ncbi:MAG: four helix bundle protein [Gemmatimonadaceae bacterium]
MSSTQHLAVWRKSHALSVRIHEATAASQPMPHADLAHRLRAVAIAIPLAVDNGAQSHTPGEFATYLEHVQLLARELVYLTSLAQAVGLIADAEGTRWQARLNLVTRMTAGLLRVLEREALGRSTPQRAAGSGPGGATPRRRSSTRPDPSG